MNIKIFSGDQITQVEQEVNDWIFNNADQKILKIDFIPLEKRPTRQLNGIEIPRGMFFYTIVQFQQIKIKPRSERKNKYVVP